MNTISTLLALALAICLVYPSEQRKPNKGLDSDWLAFKRNHSKAYNNETEETNRRLTFEDNLNTINAHNSDSSKAYRLGINQFSDLTADEFNSIYNRLMMPSIKRKRSVQSADLKALVSGIPASVNWTASGAVTPVKDQGKCGSCWSFSSTGAIEGAWFRKYNKLVSLSEQNLIDCSSNRLYGNSACNGGKRCLQTFYFLNETFLLTK